MTDNKALVSKSRKKRTQERTRKQPRDPGMLSLRVVLVSLLLWKAAMGLLFLGRSPVITDLTVGQTAPFTVQAEVDFETINLSATALRRDRAASEAPPVLTLQPQRFREIERNLRNFLDRVADTQRSPTEDTAPPLTPEEFAERVDLLNLPPALNQFPGVFDPGVSPELREALSRELTKRWNGGMLDPADRDSAFQGFVTVPRVRIGPTGPAREFAALTVPAEAASASATSLGDEFDLTDTQVEMVTVLLSSLLEPNLAVDAQATRQARLAAAQAVDPVLETKSQGSVLMEARSRITDQMLRDVQAHAERLQMVGDRDTHHAQVTSSGLLLAIGLLVSLMLMALLQREHSSDTARLVCWAVLTLFSLMLGKGLLVMAGGLDLIPGHMLRPLLPLALAPLLATILYGPRFALSVGVSSALVLSLLQGVDLTVFFCGLVITLTAALGVRSIHKRSNLFRAGLWIGGVKALVMLAAGIGEQVTPAVLTQQAVGAFSSGLLSSLMVLLLVPLFETLFKVTTDIRLLELSDMGHPLLARLAMEAPGTYHHSLMVSHLSQTAAREIRANDLLVRVCAYYHDIGKLTKPEFFIENIQGRQNPHDDLSPSMSRLIVISHVKEGVSLAHRYKLPRIIIDGIEQHHGTGVIQYFYHRARVRAEGDPANKKVTAEDYRYPGPRPKSREMGILLMADAIEAASRTVDKNKPGQIEGLVNEIIREKLNDGQLDLCGLTMAEVTAIRRSFIFSLNNMLHGRVAYPKAGDKAAPGEVSATQVGTEAAPATPPAAKDASSP